MQWTPAVDGMDRLWEMKHTEDPETREMNLVDGWAIICLEFGKKFCIVKEYFLARYLIP
jgi:predicted transcriptional regulator